MLDGLDSCSRRGGLITAAPPISVIDAFELQDAFDLVKIAAVVSANVSCEERAAVQSGRIPAPVTVLFVTPRIFAMSAAP